MPVPINNEPRCGVCGRMKTQTNRWFLARTVGPEFRYRDYNRELLGEYDEALCGMECLDRRHHEHAQKLVGMHGPNAQKLSELAGGVDATIKVGR